MTLAFFPHWPSLGSLNRVVSPIVGAFLLDNVSTAAPGILGALLMARLVSFTWRRVLFVPDLACPDGSARG